MKRFALPSVVLLVSLLFALPATGEPAPASPPAKTFLWSAPHPSGSGALHLLGSVHLRPSDAPPLAPAILEALAQSDVVSPELDFNRVDASQMLMLIMRLGLQPAGRSLQDDLGPELYRKVVLRMQGTGFAPMIDRLRPWAVAMLLEYAELSALGFSEQTGVDFQVLALARGKRIKALETSMYQLALLGGLDDEAQRSMIAEAVGHSRAESRRQLAAMMDAWQRGDVAAFEQITIGQLDQHPEYRAFYDHVLFARNHSMASKIDSLAIPGRTLFVVVGAAHLLGPQGLIALLRNKGYALHQVP